MQFDIFCDFDGTITRQDTVDKILETFALPEWEAIEADWVANKISSKECLGQQTRLIRASETEMQNFIEGIPIDLTFIRFANWVKQLGFPLWVVSEGYKQVIEQVIRKHNLPVSGFWANEFLTDSEQNYYLEFPHCKPQNGCSNAVCKCDFLELSHPERTRVIIGDGRSDFCWVKQGDIVFAKGKLIDHCKENNINYYTYESFVDIQCKLSEVLEQATTQKPASMPIALA